MLIRLLRHLESLRKCSCGFHIDIACYFEIVAHLQRFLMLVIFLILFSELSCLLHQCLRLRPQLRISKLGLLQLFVINIQFLINHEQLQIILTAQRAVWRASWHPLHIIHGYRSEILLLDGQSFQLAHQIHARLGLQGIYVQNQIRYVHEMYNKCHVL